MQASVSLRLVLILGLLSAIGPFAIDMYLPALPQIGSSLNAQVGAVQASLTAFFLSIGVGQLLYGPVSDMVGRKPPLYFGLIVFAAASVGCALAPNIETLVVFRFLQGLGAAAGMAGTAPAMVLRVVQPLAPGCSTYSVPRSSSTNRFWPLRSKPWARRSRPSVQPAIAMGVAVCVAGSMCWLPSAIS